MDFINAVNTIINAHKNDTSYTAATATNNAVKRPSWKGYIYFDIPSGATAGAYAIRYHYADGTHDVSMLTDSDPSNNIRKGTSAGNTGKVYKGTTETSANEAAVLVDYCPLTTFLMDAILNASDFFVGNKSDFDATAAGSGEF